MFSSPMLTLGPLVLPWAAVLVLAAWVAGSAMYERLAARAGLPGGPHGWGVVLVALAAARLAFVVAYSAEYAAAPWSALDIRDGGWAPWWGLAAAGGYVLLLWLRKSAWRRAAALGTATGTGLWLAGLAVLHALAPAAPAALPAWQGVSLDARAVPLAALQGRPAVVNLWASWCPPCRREMPVLLQAQRAHPGVRFVWVNQGEAPEVVLRYAAAQGLPAGDVLLDPASRLGALLGQRALPTTLFIDAQGRAVAVRGGELSAATLAQHLALIAPPALPKP